jgi:pyruvate dehydrogenase E1 component beta subunit
VFSGGKWKVPLVVRAACGEGYGDGGQHEQNLWGMLAHIPGLTVVVPSTMADAGGLMISAIEHQGPGIYLGLYGGYHSLQSRVGGPDTARDR